MLFRCPECDKKVTGMEKLDQREEQYYDLIKGGSGRRTFRLKLQLLDKVELKPCEHVIKIES